MRFFRHDRTRRTGFLARLLHDRRANTLVLMAIALVPISALAGSAVDMARLYVVKSRLQQACDAGVLAGRKFMAANGPLLDATATTQAKAFFNNNIEPGWLDTGTAQFVPVRTADNQVAGTAQVRVPMTIMKMFAVADTTIKVACQARYDIADTDVMFVLDTTGSMACPPEMVNTDCSNHVSALGTTAYNRPSSDPDALPGYLNSKSFYVNESTGGTGSRIKALRQAVKDFYATMASSIDANTRIRYGFVTYTSTVNAGKAIQSISPAYMAGSMTGETVPYQSRRVTADYIIKNNSTSANGKSEPNCTSVYSRSPATALTYDSSAQATRSADWWNSNDRKCYTANQTIGPRWTYQQYPLDVRQYLTGAAVADPTKLPSATSRWDGCIEERATEAGVYSFGSASYDLDPDLIPTSTAATRWKPMWADAEYLRDSIGPSVTNGDDNNNHYSLGDDARNKNGNYSCGKPVHRLSEMTASDIAKYVDAPDFRALGGTYHDVGMIWGVRMLSTKGIFASDNTGRTGQGTPKKVIIFLTDGEMAPSLALYGFYGIEYFDQRITDADFANAKAYHNARFLYECDKARTMGIDVWTVSIGLASTPELKKCARIEAQALWTTSGDGLSKQFQAIAKQVAMLRLQQ